MSLPKHVALITGGARGIGKAICEAFLDEKAKVCVTDILETEGEETLKYFEEKYGKENVIFYKLNVVDENEFESVAIKTKQHFGHLDIICNNAGVMNELKPKQVVDVNLMGVINGIQVAHKHLEDWKRNKGGTVINTASIAGIYPSFISPVYTATKFGVIGLTRTWGNKKNVEITKVKVNAVCPGLTKTDMINSPSNGLNDGVLKELGLKIKGKWLKPADIANGVLKILNDNVTGALLAVTNVKGFYYYTTVEKDFSDEMLNI